MIEYDLGTVSSAQSTLLSMLDCDDLGIVKCLLQNYRSSPKARTLFDDIVAKSIKQIKVDDLVFSCYHITTSKDSCESIRLAGLRPVTELLKDMQSELCRFFLDREVVFDLDNEKLLYKGKVALDYSQQIRCASLDSFSLLLKNRLGVDSGVSAFVSINEGKDYSCVADCPEIIDTVCYILFRGSRCDLWRLAWKKGKLPYMIRFKVKFHDLSSATWANEDIYDSALSEDKIKRALLEEAIYRSFGDSRAGVLRYYYFDSEAVIHSDDMEFEEITGSYDWDKGEPWEWF